MKILYYPNYLEITTIFNDSPHRVFEMHYANSSFIQDYFVKLSPMAFRERPPGYYLHAKGFDKIEPTIKAFKINSLVGSYVAVPYKTAGGIIAADNVMLCKTCVKYAR